ncbi:PF14021 domain protein [Actinomyces sp. ICM39]|uniref:glycohydrolase toxin TNT-related protein n=1 Tax=Actinomyces sp. ICM39 TaxID=1105029 RepID=UPI000277074A|nr:glycohydrolase toxin TNT-related protein [Actinomyces sp. ICM39]EJN45765.1 PF14021 domain protein [Actinomyces sp. ICM39]
MNVYYDKEKKEPIWPWDVEGLRKNGAKLNANYHEYTSITPFIKTHGEDLCRLGDPGGKFAAAVHKDGTLPSFGERGLFQPFSLGAPDMRARLTGELPEGHIVKYGEVAPAFGQPGGAIQLQIWGPDEKTGIIRELTLKEWKKRGIIKYVKHD